MRSLRVALVAVLLAGTGGCSVFGGKPEAKLPACVAPANEDALLDAYAKDPVLAVTPDGATRFGGVSQSRACRRLGGNEVSDTTATVQMRLAHPYERTALRGVYEPVTSANGWTQDGRPRPELVQGEVVLGFCREVNGVISNLTVRAQPADDEASPPGPGNLVISINADPLRADCG
jgi:hypothetical protein